MSYFRKSIIAMLFFFSGNLVSEFHDIQSDSGMATVTIILSFMMFVIAGSLMDRKHL